MIRAEQLVDKAEEIRALAATLSELRHGTTSGYHAGEIVEVAGVLHGCANRLESVAGVIAIRELRERPRDASR